MNKGDLVKFNSLASLLHNTNSGFGIVINTRQGGAEYGYFYLVDVLWGSGKIERDIYHQYLISVQKKEAT